MEGFIGGTLLLWVLSAVLVAPLTKMALTRKMAAAGVDPTLATCSAVEQEEWKKVATLQYMLWDSIILGIAGFVMGLAGYYFIGFSFNAKGWPGMISFIVSSFLGLALSGGRP